MLGYLINWTLTFISDCQKGLLQSIEYAFPHSLHDYCLRHLYDNLHKQFKHPALRACLYRVAEAITEENYNIALDEMRRISSDAVD